MAHCKVEGLDELIDEMERWEGNIEPLFEEMTLEGAKLTKEAWRKAAQKHRLKDTGELIRRIDYDKRLKKKGQMLLSYIYPRGNQRFTTGKDGRRIRRKRPIRYASIAFVRHYGTSRRPATYFVDTADQIANKTVPDVLIRRWKDFLRDGR